MSKWLGGVWTMITSLAGYSYCGCRDCCVSECFRNATRLVNRIFVGPAWAANVCSSSSRLVCGDPRMRIPTVVTLGELTEANLVKPPWGAYVEWMCSTIWLRFISVAMFSSMWSMVLGVYVVLRNCC